MVGQAGLQVGDVAVQGVVLELLKRRRDPQGQAIGKQAFLLSGLLEIILTNIVNISKPQDKSA